MSNKLFVFLIVVLSFNTLRYGYYLVAGSPSTYHIIFFVLNIVALILGIFTRNNLKNDNVTRKEG